MFIIIAIVLSAIAAVYVALPLFRQSANGMTAAAESDQTADLFYQKDLALATIKDLDFDMQTGKLAEADHTELVAAQQKIISQIEKQLSGTGQKKGEMGRPGYCPACGHPHGADARFCSHCGAALTKAN